MVDPRRRLAEADTDVIVGRAPIVVPDSGPADFDVLEAFRQSRADTAPRPADPVADDSMLSSIRRGLADYAAGGTTPAANTRRAQSEVDRATERARRESPDANRAIRLNAADALSLGFADEIAGLGNVGSRLVSGADVDIDEAYRAGRNEYRRDLADLNDRFPGSARAGQFVGNLGSMALPAPGALGRLGQGATALRRIGGAAALGGIYGGLSGLGHSEVDLTDDADMSDPVPGTATEGMTPEQRDALPTMGGQLLRDIGRPAAIGAAMGGGLATVIEAGSGIRAIYNAAQDRARLNEALGRRAQDIIESGRIPRLSGRPGDDVDIARALTDESMPEAAVEPVSQPIRTSMTGELGQILRENPDMNRLRTAGIVGKQQMRQVAQVEGGIPGFARDLDTLGASQTGEVVRTSEGARRLDEIGRIAHHQRNRILADADAAGVRVNGEEVAAEIRRRMEPLRRRTDDVALQRLRDMEEQAQKFEGRLLNDGTPNPEWTEITPRPRFMSQSESDEIAQAMGRLAGYDRAAAMPPPAAANARDVRAALVQARESALQRWNPEAAQAFNDAQRASQISLTSRPATGLSELEARGANQSLSLTDKIGGGTGAAIGSGIGTAIGGPAGGLVGAGMGGLIGTAGNRIWRDFEPSVMATLAERPILQSRLAELGIESASRELPAGLRFMVEGARLRAPRAFGNIAATPGIEAREQIAPEAADRSDADLENVDPYAGLPMPDDTGAVDDLGEIDPYAGLPMPEDDE